MKKSKTSFLLLLVLPIILAILTLTACDENVDPRTFEITMEAQQVVNTNNIQVTWEPRADIDEVRITDYYNNTEQSSVIIKNAQLTKGMHTIDSNFGKNHTINLSAYKNGAKVYNKDVTVNVGATEYNIAPLIATVPVTIMALNLNYFTNNGNIPTFVWLERADAWNLNHYPNNIFPIPTATKNEITHKQPIATIYDKTTAFVKELYEMNNQSIFHFYYNDIWCAGALAASIGNGIPADKYDITLLSDGTGSYSCFNENFNNENAETNYQTMKTKYDTLKEQITNTHNYSFASNNYEIIPWDFGKYCYVMLKEETNVTWYLNRINGTMAPNNTTIKSDLDSLVSNQKIVLYNLGNMLAALTAEEKAQIQALYNFGSAMFDVAKEQSKDIMIILGTSTSGEGTDFYAYVDALTAYYGDGYVYYYKGHPGYPTYAIPGKAEKLAQAGLLELDCAIAAELIFFFNPEAFGSGYQSSTYESLTDVQSCCLFNANYDTTTLSYKNNIEVFITKVNDGDATYDAIVEGNDKYLMQFPKSETYDVAIFDATNKTITYYKKNNDGTFTEVQR